MLSNMLNDLAEAMKALDGKETDDTELRATYTTRPAKLPR